MSGILGQVVPTAPTVLYRSPNKYASTTLQIANIGANDTYDVAVRDYDRNLTFAQTNYLQSEIENKAGKIFSNEIITVSTSGGTLTSDVSVGDTLTFLQSGTSTPTGVTAKVAKTFRKYTETAYEIVARPVDVIEVTTFSVGTIEIGDQLTDQTDASVGTVKDISDPGGGADITLVVEMTSGNFLAAEILDNVTKATTSVATVNNVTSTAANALFDNATNELFNGFTTSPGNLYIFDVSDGALAGIGFDIYNVDDLSTADGSRVLRYGTPGTDGYIYLFIDDNSSDYYYLGDGANGGNGSYANLTNVIDATGASTWTTVDSILLYEVSGTISVTDNFVANSNTFTVQTSDGNLAGFTIGKFNTAASSAKIVEYEGTFTANSLLYNNENDLVFLITAVALVADESWIAKTTALNAAATAKFAGIVLGPYNSVVVDCTSGTDLAFTLFGFEEDL